MKFSEWLPEQTERDDSVGDLARFAGEKGETFPVTPNRKDLTYALADHSQSDLIPAVDLAVDEWEQARVAEANEAEVEHNASQAEQVNKVEKKEQRAVAKAEHAEHQSGTDPRVEQREKAEARDQEVAARVQAERDEAAAPAVEEEVPVGEPETASE